MTVRAPINLGVLAGARIPHFDAPHVCDNGGPTWSAVAQPSDRYSGVAYGNGRFVATGRGQAGVTPTRTMYSLDKGQTWAAGGTIANFATTTPYGLRFGNGIFLCVISAGSTPVTTDGLTWTSRPGCGITDQRSLEYGNGVFVVANGSAATVVSTPDGSAWTSHAVPEIFSHCHWDSHRSRWLGLSKDTAHSYTSPDLVTWTQRGDMPNVGATVTTNNVAQSTSGTFVCAYNSGINTTIYTDDGGVTWGSSSNLPGGNQVNNVIFGNGIFIGVKGLSSQTVVSYDSGRTWVAGNTLTKVMTWMLAYNGRNSYAAVGGAGSDDVIADVGDC